MKPTAGRAAPSQPENGSELANVMDSLESRLNLIMSRVGSMLGLDSGVAQDRRGESLRTRLYEVCNDLGVLDETTQSLYNIAGRVQ